MVLFGMQTDEYNISREYFQKYEKGEQPLNAQQVAVLDQYIEMYLKKYLNDSLCEESDIFFRKQIGSQVKKLYSAFDELMLGFLVLTEDELSHTYQKLKAILDEFQQNKILEKMKKKLPV